MDITSDRNYSFLCRRWSVLAQNVWKYKYTFFIEINIMYSVWRIQDFLGWDAGADPKVGGGEPTYCLATFFCKSAWKWKKLDYEEDVPGVPLEFLKPCFSWKKLALPPSTPPPNFLHDRTSIGLRNQWYRACDQKKLYVQQKSHVRSSNFGLLAIYYENSHHFVGWLPTRNEKFKFVFL